MSDFDSSIDLLFERPMEPLFMPKGEDNSVFDMSPEFMPPKYKDTGTKLSNRFSKEDTLRIPLKKITAPDLSVVTELSRNSDFSIFVPEHQRISSALIDVMMDVPEGQLQEFISTAAFCRERVNPQLFNYCLSVALLHRNDTKNRKRRLPNFMESFPATFLDSQIFQQAREMLTVVKQQELRSPIVIPKDFSASDLDPEHRVAYFREDIGINLHHWHWHLVYPFTSSKREIVDKDRRGELFYYMHHQIVARYNAERLCNVLPRVVRFNNHHEPIEEGYFPKMDSLTSARTWPARQAWMSWVNINREADKLKATVDEMDLWKKRIEDAISSGFVLMPDGTSQPLDIDKLGNIIESSDVSPNAAYYGSYHNGGHILTAYMHDPEHKFLERWGVLADSGTAMRDPFFYRWHANIDAMFQKFKASPFVEPYTAKELGNPNIKVTGLQIANQNGPVNLLNTFWMKSDIDLSKGLDFSDRGRVLVRFTHLNHAPFTYRITVNNTGAAKRGTVRIFLSPKFDERNLPWRLVHQRLMMIEMDRFVVELNQGVNKINRRSDESNVTIPFERSFRDLTKPNNTEEETGFNFCGCGWPHHMLVPKGTVDGKAFQVFVMVSNYDQDKIDQNIDGLPCSDAFSYCGIKDRLYPDKRAMGYPFDRPPGGDVASLGKFLQPNMKVQDILIKFNKRTVMNPKNPDYKPPAPLKQARKPAPPSQKKN